jgi:LemA protein
MTWLLIAAGLYAVWLYNRIVARRNRTDAAWAQIDTQLKRRADLVPQLVGAVKGAMAHESSTLEAVVRARSECLATATADAPARFAAEQRLSAALAPLSVIVEANPDLKTSANVLGLQEELSSTENRIAMARQHFNDCVAEYNTAIGTAPGVFLAKAFSFQPRQPYAAEDQSKAVPRVSLG